MKGLRLFKEDYPGARLFYLYCGEHAENWNGIEVMPVADFFKMLWGDGFMRDPE